MSGPDLDSAYALNSLDDTKRMYADWADSYDQTFVADHSFVAHTHVAAHFVASRGKGPILDFGAGTGILGAQLAKHQTYVIDALDLSPEMLAVAVRKAVYRSLIAGNLLDDLTLDQRYDGIVSSGTFTHGHVGPEALDALLNVANPGAQFALSINAKHFESHGFAAAFERLAPQITDLHLPEIRLYADDAKGPHKDDMGFCALFRKA